MKIQQSSLNYHQLKLI